MREFDSSCISLYHPEATTDWDFKKTCEQETVLGSTAIAYLWNNSFTPEVSRFLHEHEDKLLVAMGTIYGMRTFKGNLIQVVKALRYERDGWEIIETVINLGRRIDGNWYAITLR